MIPLQANQLLRVHGKTGTVAIVKVGPRRQFHVETPDRELALGVGPEAVLVASGFGTDDRIVQGLHCVLYLTREVGSPLIVLPKDHPASARLKIVLAVGSRIVLSCKITPGTHPEQHLLCALPEFEGVEILGVEGGVELRGLETAHVETRNFLKPTRRR